MTKLTLDRTPRAPYVPPVLDEQQLKVVAHRSGAMRVLAGPGTGKTTTLVSAMAGRLSGPDPLKPDQVLGLTFGRRAALDWRAKVTTAVGGGLVPHVSTFHSFCYALLRKYDEKTAAEVAFRLLSGPEQQVRVRELFLNEISDGSLRFPDDLAPAINTRGLIEEVRTVMSRTRSHLMEPIELVDLGARVGRPLWELVGTFMEKYIDNIEQEHALDYAEVIYRAHNLLTRNEDICRDLQSTFKAIFIDEYQDTDPGQVAFLKQLVTADTSLIVVGDIDQAIYGFRGADETGIRKFDEQFADIYGDNIHDVVLSTCRRFGSNLRTAATAVIESNVPAGINGRLMNKHRNPACPSEDAGLIDVLTFDSEGAQAAHIADRLARAHAQQNLAWSDMAVIVRSASRTIPMIYRALISAGIPVEIAADEIPLHLDPATEPLMTLLKVIAKPATLNPDIATSILTGPIGQIDAVDLRRFVQSLRKEDRKTHQVARPSGELLVHALNNVGDLLLLKDPRQAHVVDRIVFIGNLITDCRQAIAQGKTAHDILWQVWQASTWPDQLFANALATGGSAGRANRDLDAICSLFDQANRFVSQGRARGLLVFLDEILAQEIPAEALADNQIRSNTVRLLTAHRAKGLEWPFVVVAGVQEDVWPDVRLRQTLLQADRISKEGELMPTTVREALIAERRLFYVALTRAMKHVVVTTVKEYAEDGEMPSRFIRDIQTSKATISARNFSGRPQRALSSDAIIAQLRRVLADESASAGLKNSAANRLAALISSGHPSLVNADPSNWWGVLPRTKNATYKPQEPISLSATTVQNIEDCPAQWFLDRQVRAVSQTQNHMVFGTILHSIAQGLHNEELPADIKAIDEKIDKIWGAMPYEARWISDNERQEAHRASQRLLKWFIANSQVHSIAESSLELRTTLSHTEETGEQRSIAVAIHGSADRIQFNLDGVVVYDYKTGRRESDKIETNVQLALYSFIIEHGTYTDRGNKEPLPEGTAVTGGALIHLRIDDPNMPGMPSIQQVAKGTHDSKSDVLLNERLVKAAEIVLDERYETRPSEKNCGRCQVRMLCPAMAEGRQVL